MDHALLSFYAFQRHSHILYNLIFKSCCNISKISFNNNIPFNAINYVNYLCCITFIYPTNRKNKWNIIVSIFWVQGLTCPKSPRRWERKTELKNKRPDSHSGHLLPPRHSYFTQKIEEYKFLARSSKMSHSGRELNGIILPRHCCDSHIVIPGRNRPRHSHTSRSSTYIICADLCGSLRNCF